VPPGRYPLLLCTVALGGVLAPLNSTMLAVALPEIRADFGVGHGQVSWLFSAYLIAMAVAQPLGGRLGDQLGRARVFRLGLGSFVAFSIAAALAPAFPLLVLLRAGQALTGAAVIPNGIAMLRAAVPPERLGVSTGTLSSVISISAAVGPVLGAALLGAGSWRWLFLVNVPLVTLALLSLGLLRYPPEGVRRALTFDWPGAGAYAVMLTGVSVLLGALGGEVSAAVEACGGVALVGGAVVFLYRQRTGPLPLAEWSLFRDRSYAGAAAYILLSNLVMYTTLLTIPFFLRELQGRGTGATGVLLGAMSFLSAVLAPVAGRLSDVYGRRPPAVAGSLFLLAGTVALLAGLRADVPFGYLAVCLVGLGLGMGLSTGPASTAAVETAPVRLAGAAAGANSMMRYLGSIVGTGVLGAVLSDEHAAPDVGLFRLIFAILLLIAVAACASALLIHRFRRDARSG
jgi:EmrB/QacA subfamily drug resistance transporter